MDGKYMNERTVNNTSSFGLFFQRFAELPMGTKLGSIFAVAAMAAGIFALSLWARQPDFRVLYTNLSDRDGGAIIAALNQMNIPYKFNEGGSAIMVPAGRVHDARLQLASKGLPKGSIVGFELMENQKFGTTQFQEQVNYQRALEGELARSIQALSAVESARVHLAIPKPSVFLREQQKPTASVLINLHPGQSLDRSQVSGIVHLIASSVAELPVAGVSVLDQDGKLLSNNSDTMGNLQLDPGQLAYLQQTEQSYNKRIMEILEPIVGRSNVRAQVTADLDFSLTESTAEIYRPNANQTEAAIRSQQTSESKNGSQANAQGVPGALSNQPPGPASAPINGTTNSKSLDSSGSSASRRDSTTNYEVDKTIKHTRTPVGGIKRLSAAVVVNHRKNVDKSGKVSFVALNEQQVEQVRALVKEAIGFDEKRGDSLSVANTPFTVEEVAPAVETPLWKRPEALTFAKEAGKNLLVGGLAFYLLFGIIRPFFRQLSNRPHIEPRGLSPQELGAAADGSAAALVQIDPLGSARQLARQDPKLVANVVKSWVAR
jgi:flagellar M-ring protein FliF